MRKSVFNPSFQNRDMASRIVVGLERLAESIRVLLWEQSKHTGLSPIQIQIMIFMAHHHESLCNVSLLAREFNMSKPTISDAVRVLHKKKLIMKIKNPSDLRAYSMKLTNKGQEALLAIEQYGEPLRRIVSKFSDSEQSQYLALISKMILQLHHSDILAVQRMCYTCDHFESRGKRQYCQLIEQELASSDLRLDCPEHRLTS